MQAKRVRAVDPAVTSHAACAAEESSDTGLPSVPGTGCVGGIVGAGDVAGGLMMGVPPSSPRKTSRLASVAMTPLSPVVGAAPAPPGARELTPCAVPCSPSEPFRCTSPTVPCAASSDAAAVPVPVLADVIEQQTGQDWPLDVLSQLYEQCDAALWSRLCEVHGWKVNAIAGEPRDFQSFCKMLRPLGPPPFVDKRKSRRPGFPARTAHNVALPQAPYARLGRALLFNDERGQGPS